MESGARRARLPRRRRVSRWGAAVVLAGVLLPGSAPAADPFRALDLIRPPAAQRAAKEFRVATLEGGHLKLSDLRGKVVLLNFWATWCPPCREELPGMDRADRRFRDRGLVVVAISIDVEGAKVVAPFVREHKLALRVGLDPRSEIANLYGVRGLPATLIVDRAGAVIAMALGPRDWDGSDARKLFEQILRREADHG